MPQIIPIRDLKNTSEISQRCHAANEPIFVTKNGYGDMVIMSIKMYEEKQQAEGKMLDGDSSLKSLREKYNV